jgi:hypothetical protein
MAKLWKKGRGKLGPFQPLLGRWVAEAESPMGPVRCTRVFETVLGGNYVRLTALWQFGEAAKAPPVDCADIPRTGGYQELAIIGVGAEGKVSFWSFTSDGKRSEGVVTDVTDLHPEAIGFEAHMPAGIARMAYWPEEGGCRWAVESKTAKGWKRFTEHRYRRADGGGAADGP